MKTSEADMVEEKLEGEKRDVNSLRIKFEKEILEKVALKVHMLVLTQFTNERYTRLVLLRNSYIPSLYINFIAGKS